MFSKTLLATAFFVPSIASAGGTVLTADLVSMLDSMPVVRDFLYSNLELSDVADAEVRFGPHFIHLSGGRMGPYLIDAISRKDQKHLVVVLCTSARFLNKQGRDLSNGQIEQAVSIKEKLTGVMLRDDDTKGMASC